LFEASNGKGWSAVAAPKGAAVGDHDAGYTIVARGDTPASWWRVDPTTGETLGMNPLGGTAGTEEAVLNRQLGYNLALGVSALAKCIYSAATGTAVGTEGMIAGARCVAAASLGFVAGQIAILMTAELALAALLQGISQWVGP
jgi:hypothetical protein